MTSLRKFWIIVLMLWTIGVTVMRAMRPPNDFAEAHWLLDYRFGFVKRGLVGEILSLTTRLVSIPITEKLIAALATLIFLAYCIVIVLLSLRIVHNSGWSKESVLITLVFLSSPFMVMSAHLNGYYDNIIVMLGIFSAALLLKGRYWLAACLQAVAVLVHENTMLLIFPFFCLAFLLANRRRQQSPISPSTFLPLLLPVFMFIIVTISQSSLATKDIAEAFTERLSQFPFIQGRGYLAQILTSRSFENYFAAQGSKILSGYLSGTYMFILPTTLAIFFFTINAFRFLDLSLESLGLLGVYCAPQIMHLVAWDTARIWTHTIICAFFTLWLYSEHYIAKRNISTFAILYLAAFAANITILTPLMDGQSDHFSLSARLLLYAPVIAGSLILIFHREHTQNI